MEEINKNISLNNNSDLFCQESNKITSFNGTNIYNENDVKQSSSK